MNFTNKQFEKIYLKLIMEESEGVQFKYICKSCNTGFTDENGVAEGDACPVESCEDGKVENFIADDIDPDNMPTAYESDDDVECDLQDDDLQDDDFEDDECDMQDDDFQDEDDELQDDDLQDDDLQDDDFEDDECDMQDDDLQDDDFQDEDDELQDDDLQDDDFQDEDADDEAAKENDEEDDEDADEENDADDENAEGATLISFTSEDAALIELLQQVQAGELKLVGVPLDFEFDEEELQEAPVISAETVNNFEIESVTDDEDEDEDEDEDDNNQQENDEDQQDDQNDNESDEQLAKECNKYMCGMNRLNASKYGPY